MLQGKVSSNKLPPFGGLSKMLKQPLVASEGRQPETIINFTSMIEDVDAPFNINGTLLAPFLSYKGANAASNTWTSTSSAGPTLTRSGNAPTLGIAQPFLDNNANSAVEFSGGTTGPKYEDNTASGLENLGTDDLILEFFGTSASSATTTCNYISAFDNTGPEGSWRFGDSSSNARFFMQLAGVGIGVNGANGGNTGFFHAIVFVDRSDTGAGTGMQIFINGELKASGTFTLAQTTAPATGGGKKLVLGGSDQAGSAAFGGNIAFVRIAKGANLFSGGAANTTLWAKMAGDRFYKLSGLYANKYPIGAQAFPSKVGKSNIIQVIKKTSDNRLIMIPTSSATRGGFISYLPSPEMIGLLRYNATTNLMRRSSALDTAPWVNTNASVATVSNTPSPCWNRNGYGVTSTAAVVGQHGISMSTSTTISIATMCASIFVKAATSKLVPYLKINCSTTANSFVFFDFNNSVISSSGSAVLNSGVENWGDGWFRVWFTFNSTAVIVQTMQLLGSTDGVTDTYTGTGVVDFIANGIQLEGGLVRPTMWVETAASATSRTAGDGVFFDNTLITEINNCNVELNIGCPNGPQPNITGGSNTGNPNIYGWDDGSGNKSYLTRTTSLKGNDQVTSVANITSVNNIASGAITKVKITTQNNNYKLFQNNILEGSDSVGTTTVSAGWFWFFANGTLDPLNNAINKFKVFPL